MRVIETLGISDGDPAYFLYRREADALHFRHVMGKKETDDFTIATSRWTELLRDIETGDLTTFGVSVSASPGPTSDATRQAPHRSFYETATRILGTRDDGQKLSTSDLACIAAVLFHEGVFKHYSGVLGRAEPARVVLRRSKTT